MKMMMKTALAVLVLMLAISYRRGSSILVSGNDERIAQDKATAAESLTFNVVRIGKQIWQKKYLAASFSRNGDHMPERHEQMSEPYHRCLVLLQQRS